MSDTPPEPVPAPLQREWLEQLRDLLGAARDKGKVAAQQSALEPEAVKARLAAQRAALAAALKRLQPRALVLTADDAARQRSWTALADAVSSRLRDDADAAELERAQDALRAADEQLDSWSDALSPTERQAQALELAERAQAAADAQSLRDELGYLSREFALLRASADAKGNFEALERLVLQAVGDGRLDEARVLLGQLPPLIRKAEATADAPSPLAAAAAERKRRLQLLAMLRRREAIEGARSIEAASANLALKRPSPKHNELDADLYQARLRIQNLVAAAEKELDTADAAIFNAAVGSAVRKLDALGKQAAKIAEPAQQKLAAADRAALTPKVKAAMTPVAAKELKRFRAHCNKRIEIYDELGVKGLHAQQRELLARLVDALERVDEFVAARAAVAGRLDALNAADAALPEQRDALQGLFDRALADVDARFVADLPVGDAFDPLIKELAAVEAFVPHRRAFEAAAAAAREAWERLRDHADAEAAKLGPRVEALPATEALHVDTVQAERKSAEALKSDLAAAEKLLADFRAADKAWAAVPAACTGKLAGAGNRLKLAVQAMPGQAKVTGYAASLKDYNLPAAGAATAALKDASSLVAQALKASRDADLVKFLEVEAAAIDTAIDLAEPGSFAAALSSAQDLLKRATTSAGYLSKSDSAREAIKRLQAGKTIEGVLVGVLDGLDKSKVLKPEDAAQKLSADLLPRVQAAQRYVLARKPIGVPFNKLAPRAPEPQKGLLARMKSGAESAAEKATVQDLDDAAAKMAALLDLIPSVDSYVGALARTEGLMARAKRLVAKDDPAAAKADSTLQGDIDAAVSTVATSITASDYEKAASALTAVAGKLEGVCKTRNAAARQGVKDQFKGDPVLSAALDDLCSRKGVGVPGAQGRSGDECFEALLAQFPPTQLAALIGSLHKGRAAQPGEDPALAAKATGNTLLNLARDIEPAELAPLVDQGLGGPEALGTLLQQGFSGSTTQIVELAAAYPDEPSRKALKKLLDDGFGGMGNMAVVVKLGCPSVKRLQALQASFDNTTLRALMDQGLGGAEALGVMLGTGCKQDAAKLKALTQKFDNPRLKTLVNDGCGSAANLASVLGDGCDGDADQLDKLAAPFSATPADLGKMKEMVESLGGSKAGRGIKTLADRHFGGDVAKLKTPFYDSIAAGGPPVATAAERKQLIAAAPAFEGTAATGNEFKVALDSSKFDEARVQHFLERHSRKHFILGDKVNKNGVPKSNIKADNTQWGPDVGMDTLKDMLAAAISATKNHASLSDLERKNMAQDEARPFEPELPAYGVRVRISYKKYKDGDKLSIDQFFPIAKTAAPGTVKDVAIEQFPKTQMNRLKAAFGK